MAPQSEDVEEAQRRITATVLSGGRTLSLAGLGLDSVPASVTAAHELTEFDLSGNRLTELPDWIGELAALRLLNLSDNLLSELPDRIGELAALETLLLRGNRLVTVSTATASLGSLVRIDLADNQLIDIPPGLARLRRLEHIDLSGNRHLISPPPEVVARGAESVLAYLRGLDLEAGRPRAELVEVIAAFEPQGGAASAPVADRLRKFVRSARVDGASARRLIALGGVVVLICGIALAVATGIGDGSATTAKAANAVTASASAPQSGASPVVLTDPPFTAQSPNTSPTAPGASKAAPRTSAPPVVAPVLSPSAKPAYPVAPANVDLARGRPVTATSETQNYVASNVVDGDTSTYWESTDGTNIYPQTLTVDLGSVTTVGRLVLDLPPYSNWNSRTQTLSVLGSGDGGRYSTIVGSTGYLFDARTGDTVTLTFSPVHVRYVQLYFTANSGWPAAQLSELAVYS